MVRIHLLRVVFFLARIHASILSTTHGIIFVLLYIDIFYISISAEMYLYRHRRKKKAPEVRLELTTYRLTAGRAADCAIQDLVLPDEKNCAPCGGRTRDFWLIRPILCRLS